MLPVLRAWVFGTLEVDASDAVDDIELTDMEISFMIAATKTGNLADIEDCVLMDGDDEVGDMRGSLSGGSDDRTAENASAVTDQARFNFDDFEVKKGEEVDVDIVCNISDKAKSTNEYIIDAQTGDVVEYKIGRDDHEYKMTDGDKSRKISVSTSGSLDVRLDNPDDEALNFDCRRQRRTR